MVMRSSRLLFLFLSLSGVTPLLLSAQDVTTTLRGQVIDIDTRVTLPGASVRIVSLDPERGTACDVDGRFRIENVPVGRHAILVQSIGYEERLLSNLVLTSGRETSVVVELRESLDEGEEVIVTATQKGEALNQMTSVSARSFSVDEASRYAASFWDPARMAQSYAGVASADDENNDIVVRGNSPRGLLWRLEGMEIPNPNHFRDGPGSSGGGVSMISNTVLSNSDFLTGAFPGEYGNGLSGAFDLRFRSGNSDQREYTLQLGALGGQASLEGPLPGANASYLFNYRYADLSLLDAIGIKFGGENAIAPKFQDINFVVNLPQTAIGGIRLWGIGGISEAGDRAVRDSALWDNRGDRFENSEKHTTGVIGLNHLYVFPSQTTYIKSIINVSHSESINSEDTIDNSYLLHPVEREVFTNTDIRASLLLNHKVSAQHVLRFGGVFSSLGYDLLDSRIRSSTGEFVTLLDESGRTGLVQGYGAWQYRPSEEVTLNLGLHYMRLLLNGSQVIEPRFGARWQIDPKHTISYGAGLHSRAEPVAVYLAESVDDQGVASRPNEDLALPRALHNVLGYDWSINRNLRVKAEVYHQHLFDVPVAADSSFVSSLNYRSGYTTQSLVNEGTGRNIGVELTVEKFFSDDYYLLFTSSLFDSKYTALDGVERNTLFNGNYIFNLLGGKEFHVGSTDQNVISIDLRGIYRGGYRFIPVDLQSSREAGRTVYDFENVYESRASDYYRLDVGFGFQHNNSGWSWTLEVDLQNALDRHNVLREFYNPFTDQLEVVTYSGLIPSLNFLVSF